MANSIAPYHVVIGGKNEVRPNATGMATHNANTGRAIRTRQIPTSKISRPLAQVQGNGHVVLHIGVGILRVVDAGDGGVPAIQLSGYFDTGGRFFAALAATGEHIGRDDLQRTASSKRFFRGSRPRIAASPWISPH